LRYELINEKGEPHNKTFTIAVMINDKKHGICLGGSKKRSRAKSCKG
jgi:ribonuclease-3